MSERVILTLKEDETDSTVYVFEGRCRCLVGRAQDCDIQLAPAGGHLDVSRHHCLLEIDPPGIRVLDLGSLNGTFINGRRIAPKVWHAQPTNSDPSAYGRVEVTDGDEIRIGHTRFGVMIDHVGDSPEERFRFPAQPGPN